MQKLVLDAPLMYADHHVTQARHILQAIPGVTDIAASSAFHRIEIVFDPAQVSAEALVAALREAGYVNDGQVLVSLPQANGRGDPAWERLGVRATTRR